MSESIMIAVYLLAFTLPAIYLACNPPFLKQWSWFIILLSITIITWLVIYFSDELHLEISEGLGIFSLGMIFATAIQGALSLILLQNKKSVPDKTKNIASLYPQLEHMVQKLSVKRNCSQIYAIIIKCYDGGRIDFCYATEAMYQKACSKKSISIKAIAIKDDTIKENTIKENSAQASSVRYDVNFFQTLPLDFESENGFRPCDATLITRYINKLKPALEQLDTTEDFMIYLEIVNATADENERWKRMTV